MRVVEEMFCEALVLADPFFLIRGADEGRPLRMSEAIHDMRAYSRLSDYVFKMLANSSDPQLAPARAILDKIARRDLYPCVGETVLPASALNGGEQAGESIAERILRCSASLPGVALKAADMIVNVSDISFGMGAHNPVDRVSFFSALPADEAGGGAVEQQQQQWQCAKVPRETVSSLIPPVFQERTVRIFVRDVRHAASARAAFEAWCAVSGGAVAASRAAISPARPAHQPYKRMRLTADGVASESSASAASSAGSAADSGS